MCFDGAAYVLMELRVFRRSCACSDGAGCVRGGPAYVLKELRMFLWSGVCSYCTAVCSVAGPVFKLEFRF